MATGVLSKRVDLTINLAAVIVAAIFLAHAVGHEIAARCLLDALLPAPSQRSAVLLSGAPMPARTYDITVRRDLFCSDCTRSPAMPSLEDSSDDEGAATPLESQLPLTYVASVFCRSDPHWSFASITNDDDASAAIYHVGSVLPVGDGRVTAIESNRVTFETHGHLEYLPLSADSMRAANGTPVDSVTVARSNTDSSADGVHKLSSTEWQIDRHLFAGVLADPAGLAQQARVVPSVDPEGQPNGFRLDWIRPGSVLAALGLQAGDTIQAVNGSDISTLDKLASVYQSMQSAGFIALGLTRTGQPLELDYIIR
jgi:type II secretion system protein C